MKELKVQVKDVFGDVHTIYIQEGDTVVIDKICPEQPFIWEVVSLNPFKVREYIPNGKHSIIKQVDVKEFAGKKMVELMFR